MVRLSLVLLSLFFIGVSILAFPNVRGPGLLSWISIFIVGVVMLFMGITGNFLVFNKKP